MPNDSVELVASDKVRQLQRQLWAAAKRAPGRRLHASYGQVFRDDALHEAWKRARPNKGAAGADRVPDLLALTQLLAPFKTAVPDVVVLLPALADYDQLIEVGL